MQALRGFRSFVIVSLAAALSGCATMPGFTPTPEPLPLPPMPVAVPQPTSGAIYSEGFGLALFEDVKAHNVGDTLTVVLVENTAAKKSAATNTSKNTTTSMTNPTLFGKVINVNSGLSSANKFAGEGDTAQSNQLSGSITVTVVERLPNGNLRVRGDKKVDLSQGSETMHVQGVVRPADIGANNTLTSDRIAEAQIAYRGTGALADANAQGWLARFFNSPWFPF